MSKRYSKEEVVLIINSYREQAWINGNDWSSYIKWAEDNGFTDKPTRKTPTVDKDRIERFDKPKYFTTLEGVEEYYTAPTKPSYDKVMEAIERAEERGRTNSKHIHTLQTAVNTLLDEELDSTWWSRLMNRNN